MARCSLIWTALPNGWSRDGSSLRLSVLLSPRFEPEGQKPELASFFPDWEDWPARLAKATFTVVLGGVKVVVPAAQTTGANRVDDTLGLADSEVWRALFKPELPVRPGTFDDRSHCTIVSYDAAAMAGFIRGAYASMAAAAGDDLPRATELIDHPAWSELREAASRLDRAGMDEKTGLRDPRRQFERFRKTERGAAPPLEGHFGRFQLFHTPASAWKPVTHARAKDPRITATWREHEQHGVPKPDELRKTIDVHQVVAAMNNYPTLLRRLGLVVDLLLDPAAFLRGADLALAVHVDLPQGTVAVSEGRVANPTTHTRLSAREFAPVSNPAADPAAPRLAGGLLDLDPSRYALLQADVDAAGLKALNFARTLSRLAPEDHRADSVTRAEQRVGAPTLRNAGLMLVHRERATHLAARILANKALNDRAEAQFATAPPPQPIQPPPPAPPPAAPPPPELWAQDLVRGYRFDVWDSATGRWTSLCRRNATYLLEGGKLKVAPEPEEEGTVRLATTRSVDPATNPDLLFLHEALVSWTGWSLAAPPPGRAIKPDDGFDTTTAQTDAELPPGIDFASRFKPVPGSLPRLRYGRRYWIRARVVDLAGNALPFSERDLGHEDPAQHATPYRRFDPLLPPAIALARPAGGATEKPLEGESMERIAIRSFNDTPADNTTPTKAVSRRIAVPPQSSVRDAEHHGMLDRDGRVDPATYAMLSHLDKEPGKPGSALDLERIPCAGPLDPTPVETTFAVYREGEALTYLPDPLAEVVVARVFNHPHIDPAALITIPLYPEGAWPEARPFSVAVVEDGAAPPRFDAGSRTLVVPLPKGVTAQLRLSMGLSPQALDRLGIWGWLSPADQQAQERRALSGQHWMLTPWRTLELTHATQRPLIAPEFYKLHVVRAPGWTCAHPQFHAKVSVTSTDRIDLRAAWHEPLDDAADPASALAPADRTRGDLAYAIKISDPSRYAMRSAAEPYGGSVEHTLEAPDLIGVGGGGHDMVVGKVHEFHDTRYRRIEYWMEATTRYREFMPAKLLLEPGPGTPGAPALVPTEAHIKVEGPKQVAWIPSSAPPPAPDVLSIIPTFGWTRTTDDSGAQTSRRRGGGLRIYLDRPWGVSGYGEMLAVVLPPEGFSGDPDAGATPYKTLATQWGNDPIWRSPFVKGIAPPRAAFPRARTAPDPSGAWLPPGAPPTESDQGLTSFRCTDLVLPGCPESLRVEIAPHDVHFDPERRLWYCDVEIEAGASYFPFVRLALARYQPHSVDGAHLSNVVLADFMALANDRTLTVQRGGDGASLHVTLHGSGYSDSSGRVGAAKAPSMSLIDPVTHAARAKVPADVAPHSVIEVWVERLDPARGEDFGWVRLAGATATPSSAPEPRPELGPAGRGLEARLEPRPGLRPELGSEPRPELGRRIASEGGLRERAAGLPAERHLAPSATERLVPGFLRALALWDGTVQLPAPPAPGERYRLVVAEYEEYLADDANPYDRVPESKARRLVYVEHVELG